MRTTLIYFMCFFTWQVIGQSTIQVNPDGTHSTIYTNGNTSTIVNPNGTHTTQHHNGQTTTQINPDGTHTIQHHNGQTTTQINPDGTHTIIQHSGESAVYDNSYQNNEQNKGYEGTDSTSNAGKEPSENTQMLARIIAGVLSLGGIIFTLLLSIFLF